MIDELVSERGVNGGEISEWEHLGDQAMNEFLIYVGFYIGHQVDSLSAEVA